MSVASLLVTSITTYSTVTEQGGESDQDRMSGTELASYTCGDVTQAKEFNFVSPGQYDESSSHKVPKKYNLCKLWGKGCR